MKEPAENSRLYQRVSEDLAMRIRSGQYGPGDRLPAERMIAQNYGVSRPTVREAIIALEVDGLVEVKTGSGVYVSTGAKSVHARAYADIGPFELLEARHAIEGEACAMAAERISDGELAELAELVSIMMDHHDTDLIKAEDADRRFHLAIAKATQNSAMVDIVDRLWEARERSPQYKLLTEKAHAAGIVPRIDEHLEILEALRAHSPAGARAAMQRHISRVLESIMEATEVHEVEQARERVAAQRRRYKVAV